MAIQTDVWVDELSINAPGAPLAALQLAINGAIADFLRKSGAFAKALPAITLRAGKADYTLARQPEGTILFLHAVFMDNRPLRHADGLAWERLSNGATGTPAFFRGYVDDAYKVTVYPTPSEAVTASIVPYVAFGYDPDCNEYIPDVFQHHWYDTILSGAIFRLVSQPRKPFSSPELASYHGRVYGNGVIVAREQARKQFVESDEHYYFPAWA